MYKIILAVLLAAIGGNAVAEWVPVDADRGDTFYADPDTVLRAGNMVTIEELTDLKSPRTSANVRPYLSSLSVVEYDCDKSRFRILSLRATAENMGQGEIIADYQFTDKWAEIPVKSVAATMKAYACGDQNWRRTAGVIKTIA